MQPAASTTVSPSAGRTEPCGTTAVTLPSSHTTSDSLRPVDRTTVPPVTNVRTQRA